MHFDLDDLRYEIKKISDRKCFLSSLGWGLWNYNSGLNEYWKIFEKYSKKVFKII